MKLFLTLTEKYSSPSPSSASICPEKFIRTHSAGAKDLCWESITTCELWQKWYKDSRRKMVVSAIEAAASREFRSSGTYFETPEKMWALYDIIERVVPLIRCFWRLELGLDEIVGERAAP